MITYNDKIYRNLEEQVLQNKQDIQYIIEEAGVLNEFGIKVVGVVNSPNDLPNADEYEGEYGDAYAVGLAAPYTLYVWTRPNASHLTNWWFNIGQFPAPSTVPGPIGPQGIQGNQGIRGSLWYSQSGAPTNTTGVNINDQALNGTTGDVYQYSGSVWQKTGNIRGPQGIQGIQGIQGNVGPVGPVGPQGPEGPAGQSIQFAGTVDNINQLPAPSTVPRNSAYLVGTTSPYDIYLIVGDTTLEWVNAGKFGGGTDVVVDGASQTQVDISYLPKISVNYQIGDSTTVSTNSSEITISNLQTIGYDVNNNQIEGMGTIELPIADSGDIVWGEQNNTLQAYFHPQVWNTIADMVQTISPETVQITAPTTSTNGQLTEEQLEILQTNTGAYLMFNNEIYRLQDTEHISGYLVYSHLGYENTTQTYKVKCITITISTKGWVLTEKEISDGGGTKLYAHDVTFKGTITVNDTTRTVWVGVTFITSRQAEYTSLSVFASNLYSNYGYNTRLPATGYVLDSSNVFVDGILAITQQSSNQLRVITGSAGSGTGYVVSATTGANTFIDRVRTL